MNNIFKDKKVLVTGHTGFKGSWLCLWLLNLGAKVYGISLYHPSNPSNYKVLKISKEVKSLKIDIVDKKKLISAFKNIKPQFGFQN